MDKNFKGTPEEYKEYRQIRNEANRRYYSKPEVKERKKKYKEIYDKENKEKISEYGYKIRARPETQERLKKWREDNRERLKEYRQRPDRKEKKKISDKKYWGKVKNNPERHKRHLEKQQLIRKLTRPRIRKYNQKYYTSPKGIVNYTKHNHRRLALIKERPFNLTKENIKKIIKRDKVCVYCGSNKKLELDHLVPLKLGGTSLFNNFVLACKSCNCRKSGKDVFKFCKNQGIQVPQIVKTLLQKQKLGIEN